jgi:hypothetical protein
MTQQLAQELSATQARAAAMQTRKPSSGKMTIQRSSAVSTTGMMD